jgi:ankyrin repeat protein
MVQGHLGNEKSAATCVAADGRPALIVSVSAAEPDPAIVGALLAAGADPNASDGDGRRVLHLCTSDIIADAVLSAGADVNAIDAQGATALHYAVMPDSDEGLVRALLRSGANPNAAGPQSNVTPLHVAAMLHQFDAARLLLDFGADVNRRSANGMTPLAIAMEAENRSVVYLLQTRGGHK